MLKVRRPLRLALAASLLVAIGACDSNTPSNAAGTGTQTSTKAGGTAAPASRDWSQVVTATPEGGYLMGNPNAQVKLLEFGSLQCSHCAEFHEKSKDALQNYVKSGKVSYEFRTFILGPLDVPVSLAARCQGAQPFFRISGDLYEAQHEWMQKAADNQSRFQALQNLPQAQQLTGILEMAGLDGFFRARGLPSAKLQQCMSDQKQIELLAKIRNDAVNNYGLTGTPTFVLNGETVKDVYTWEALEPKLKAAIG